MEFEFVEDFLVLAQEMNFSRAAEERNITQPAFSRRIKHLEEWIGTPLFERTSRSVSLTPAGLAFRARATVLVRLVAEARQEALEAAGQAMQTLSFAATHALSFTFMPKWLMHVTGPADIGALNMVSDSYQQCERQLLRGEVSFFMCHRHPGAFSGLPGRQFKYHVAGHDRLTPLSAPDSTGNPKWGINANGGAIPHLAYANQSGLCRILEADWRGRSDLPHILPKMHSLLAATNLEMAKEGQGVAWLPFSLAEHDIAERRLVLAGGPEFDVPVEIVVYRPRSRLTPHAEAFWEKLLQRSEFDLG